MQYSKLKEFKFIQFTPSQLLSPRIPFRATKDYGSKLLVPEFTTKWKVEGKVITYSPTDCCEVRIKCWEGYSGIFSHFEILCGSRPTLILPRHRPPDRNKR